MRNVRQCKGGMMVAVDEVRRAQVEEQLEALEVTTKACSLVASLT